MEQNKEGLNRILRVLEVWLRAAKRQREDTSKQLSRLTDKIGDLDQAITDCRDLLEGRRTI